MIECAPLLNHPKVFCATIRDQVSDLAILARLLFRDEEEIFPDPLTIKEAKERLFVKSADPLYKALEQYPNR